MDEAAAPRIVAHLDMDAFFASVELLRYPDLRGQPVVVGGRRANAPREVVDPATGQVRREYARLRDYTGRGVITTATYEARKFGVNSAMGLMKAALKAPDAFLLPADFDAYRSMSRRFKATVAELAPLIEDRGIDEIYIELTPVVAARIDDPADAWWCAREVAQEIRAAVKAATQLTCSVGLAPNKLLAKIGSELDKPDGLTVITANDVPHRIWPLPVRRLQGIGPKAEARLQRLGIATIGELAKTPLGVLRSAFGIGHGDQMRAAAHGEDSRPIVTHSEPVSVSRETTLEHDLHPVRDRAKLTPVFTWLCEKVSEDLRRKGYQGRTIGIKLRFEDFTTVTRDSTLPQPIDDPQAIRHAAGLCLKRVPLQKRIRLLGVRIGSLSRAPEAATPPAPAAPPSTDGAAPAA